jgi:hypothetical protein
MREHEAETSSSQLDTSNQIANNYDRQFGPIDEKRFENAKWWRNLNRWMSVVGFLIIAAIVCFPLRLSSTFTDIYRSFLSSFPSEKDGAAHNLPLLIYTNIYPLLPTSAKYSAYFFDLHTHSKYILRHLHGFSCIHRSPRPNTASHSFLVTDIERNFLGSVKILMTTSNLSYLERIHVRQIT